MRADRQTEMTKLTIAFRNFENAPNEDAKVPGYDTPFALRLLVVHMQKNRPGFCCGSG
jgi:hypothetical protein